MNKKDIIKLHKVLSDPVRWDIVEYLKFNHNQSATELANHFKIEQSTLSFHMKKIQAVKLVTSKKSGKFLVYNVNFKTLEDLYLFMDSIVKSVKMNQKPLIFTKKILIETYAAYADPIRMKLLDIILEKPSISGKELRIISKVSDANIVFHTNKLEEAHIISSKKIGNQRYYWPNVTFLVSFHEFITNTREVNYWHNK